MRFLTVDDSFLLKCFAISFVFQQHPKFKTKEAKETAPMHSPLALSKSQHISAMRF